VFPIGEPRSRVMRAARAGGDEAIRVERSRAFLFRPVPHCAPGRSSFPGPFAARNVAKREEATVAKPDKVDAVTDIADKFRASSAAVVTEYRGLTMAQLSTLRRTLGVGVSYRVAKNTLVKRTAQDAGVQGLDDLFVGPTAIAFVEGEPVDAAKALRDFAKD